MMGCSGGSRLGAIQYINANGIDSVEKYPWTGKKDTCKKLSGDIKFNFKKTAFDGCEELKNGLFVSPLTSCLILQSISYSINILSSLLGL